MLRISPARAKYIFFQGTFIIWYFPPALCSWRLFSANRDCHQLTMAAMGMWNMTTVTEQANIWLGVLSRETIIGARGTKIQLREIFFIETLSFYVLFICFSCCLDLRNWLAVFSVISHFKSFHVQWLIVVQRSWNT